MGLMEPRWDQGNQRWECSLGSGKSRTWFRTKVKGEEGRAIVIEKRRKFLEGPAPLIPGSLAEFIESVWWPRQKITSTKSTLDGYRSVLKRAIRQFYPWQVEHLTLEVLQPWVSGLKGSPKTVQNVYRVMSSILQLAHLTGRYSRMDHKLVVLPEVGESWAVDGLDPQNIAKILKAAAGTIYEGPIWAAAFLGLRRNEICGLKKGHISIEGKTATITVRDNRQVGIETNKLKSKKKGEARVLKVPREMGERLLGFGASHDGIYIFHGLTGLPIQPNRLTECMAGICDKAKVKHIAFKDLRSSCRSNLDAADVPDTVIMAILGHSNMKTSLRYQDRRASRQVEAFRKLMSG